MDIESRIGELGYELPEVSAPAHPYRPVVVFDRVEIGIASCRERVLRLV